MHSVRVERRSGRVLLPRSTRKHLDRCCYELPWACVLHRYGRSSESRREDEQKVWTSPLASARREECHGLMRAAMPCHGPMRAAMRGRFVHSASLGSRGYRRSMQKVLSCSASLWPCVASVVSGRASVSRRADCCGVRPLQVLGCPHGLCCLQSEEEVASESRADTATLRRLSCRVRISARLARLQTRDV